MIALSQVSSQNVGMAGRSEEDYERLAALADQRQPRKGMASGSKNGPPRMKDLPRARGKESPTVSGLTVARRQSLLGPFERLVLAALCDHANSNSAMWPVWVPKTVNNGPEPSLASYAAWPSVCTIGACTALCDRSVRTALKNLVRAGAIKCIYQSRGGAIGPHGRASCYLITPELVREEPEETIVPDRETLHAMQSTTAREAHPSSATLHRVLGNPAQHAGFNPACCAGKESNHHHQEEESNKNKQRSRNSNRIPDQGDQPAIATKHSDHASRSDDDESAHKRAPFEDPKRELITRMTERHPLDDPQKLMEMIWSELDYDLTDLTEFLKFDWAHTGAPNKIRNAGGHYKALIQKLKRSKKARIVSALKDQQRRVAATEKSRQQSKPVCALGKCCGDGIISAGEMPVGICDCEIGQNLAPERIQIYRDLIASLGSRQRMAS